MGLNIIEEDKGVIQSRLASTGHFTLSTTPYKTTAFDASNWLNREYFYGDRDFIDGEWGLNERTGA